MKTLLYIIQYYLYNSKNQIETQRLTEKWFIKNKLAEEWHKYQEYFLNREKLYAFMVENNIQHPNSQTTHENGYCVVCKSQTKFKGLKYGYNKYCSSSCAGKATINLEKMKETMLLKYGVENAFQMASTREVCRSVEVINKRTETMKRTCMEKYGVEWVLSLKETREKIFKTKEERYGDGNYVNIDKQKQFYKDNYGVEWNSQIKEIKTKQVQTLLLTGNILNENGLTVWQQTSKNRKEDVDDNGLNSFERAIELRKSKDENNINSYDKTFTKRKEDIDDNGLNSYDRAKIKQYITNVNNGNWTPKEEWPEFKLYSNAVWKETNKCAHLLENFDKRGRNSGEYHIDHRYSIFQGFKDKIPSEIIGSIFNLEMIESRVNISKNIQCSITKEELYSLYKKF